MVLFKFPEHAVGHRLRNLHYISAEYMVTKKLPVPPFYMFSASDIWEIIDSKISIVKNKNNILMDLELVTLFLLKADKF